MKYLYLMLILISTLDMNGQNDRTKKEISIFTDGNSYVQKEISILPNKNLFRISNRDIPNARMGTLWISDSMNSIQYITSYLDTVLNESIKSTTIEELLANNIGKHVDIGLANARFRGKIKGVSEKGYVHLEQLDNKDQGQWQFFHTSNILNIFFVEKPQLTWIANKYSENISSVDTEKVVEVAFSKPGKRKLTMEYLQKGMTWKPFYYLEIQDKKRGNLKIQAEIINDSEDIKNANINFVVGVPNFKYANYLTDLIDFKNLLDPLYEPPYSSGYQQKYSASSSIIVTGTNTMDNKKLHDFHIYRIENLSLRKNSRMHHILDEQKLRYEHIYECDMVPFTDYLNTYNYNRNANEQKNIVYHSLKFVNDSEHLLGEGPIMILDGTDGKIQPLAQDKLYYTAAGATTLVKITESPDIEIGHKEIVIERYEEPTKFWGREYYRAKVKGFITVENYKKEDINLELRYHINGEIVHIDDRSEVLFQKQPAFNLNQINKVQWNLELGELGDTQIEYEFIVYVNR